jgi:hypothetical protein
MKPANIAIMVLAVSGMSHFLREEPRPSFPKQSKASNTNSRPESNSFDRRKANTPPIRALETEE